MTRLASKWAMPRGRIQPRRAGHAFRRTRMTETRTDAYGYNDRNELTNGVKNVSLNDYACPQPVHEHRGRRGWIPAAVRRRRQPGFDKDCDRHWRYRFYSCLGRWTRGGFRCRRTGRRMWDKRSDHLSHTGRARLRTGRRHARWTLAPPCAAGFRRVSTSFCSSVSP